MNESDVEFLVQQALLGNILDISVGFAKEDVSRHECSYGHRVEIPSVFQDLGPRLLECVARNLIVHRMRGGARATVDRTVLKPKYFVHFYSGEMHQEPLILTFAPWPDNVRSGVMGVGLRRWNGALHAAMTHGVDISYDCAALTEASRAMQGESDISREQLCSTVYDPQLAFRTKKPLLSDLKLIGEPMGKREQREKEDTATKEKSSTPAPPARLPEIYRQLPGIVRIL